MITPFTPAHSLQASGKAGDPFIPALPQAQPCQPGQLNITDKNISMSGRKKTRKWNTTRKIRLESPMTSDGQGL